VTDLIRYICEVCDTEKILTEEQAFNDGWDYPPFIGAWTVISPRTCGNCGIDQTLYWRIICATEESPYTPTDKDMALIQRIQAEPESVQVTDTSHNAYTGRKEGEA
jgi:hypothetical protein